MTAYKYQTKKGIRWEYLCNYTDYDGKKRQKHQQGFLTRRDALEAERQFLNTKKFDDETTLRTIVELFREKKYKELKDATVRSYEVSINRFQPLLDLPLSSLNDEVIKEYFDSLPVSPASKRKYASSLKAIYAFGAKTCSLPTDHVSYSAKVKKRDYSIYTLEEYMEFRKYLSEMSRVFFDLLYFTGIRKGEAMALDVKDISDVISIRKTIDVKGIVTSPKTDSSIRTVAIPPFLLAELNEYIKKLPEGQDQPLFPVSISYFQHHHRKAERLSGLHHIRIHDFRHSHASYLIAQGVNIADISKRLGHSSIRITLETYAHLYNDNDKTIADLLEKSVRIP